MQEHRHPGAIADPREDFGPASDRSRVGQTAPADPLDAALEAFDAGTTLSIDAAAEASDDDSVDASAPVEAAPVEDASSTAASTSPSPETKLLLGDVALRKEDVIAFIHFGHSNMAGRATQPLSERGYFFDTHPHALMYHVGKTPELAVEPYTAGDKATLAGNRAGPGMALLKRALELAPNKYFMSLGFAHSSARCRQFLPGSLYYESITQAAIAIKDRVTFGAIVIMLGITEDQPSDRMNYTSCIDQLVSAIRKDVDRPDLPVLLSDYERGATGDLAVTGALAQSIIPEIQKLPGIVSKLALVPTDGLEMEDDHHFDFVGHEEWARRAVDLMKTHDWFPWTAAIPGP